ncbi:DMT family transporter [Algirhabdus cladophorae]|uniref:DMT family transporter n=1 Tax=Algirhabdus cladophorae TaxID=3377108 RepID=UPI003B849447
MSENTKGAAFMVLSMSAFTLNDACLKGLAGEVPLFQALFLRSIGTVAMLGVMCLAMGHFKKAGSAQDWKLIRWRMLGELGAAYCFVQALYNMPIANVSAILQSLPLTVTLAGTVFLGEVVGWRRLLAIGIGFAGVMLIVRPGTDGFSSYSIYALGAVAFVTLRDIMARKIGKDIPSVLIAFVTSAGVLAFAGLGTFTENWAVIKPASWTMLAGSATFILGGYVFSIAAMRHGEISFVAPFRYVSLLVALILGAVFFREIPDALMMIGAGIVVATGLFTLYREHRT